jgi:hypothetical protein
MPGQFFKDIFTSDASELVRLYKSVYGQAQSSQSVQHIIAFSKALAECSVPEGYILMDAIKDIETNIKSFKDLKYIWNRVLKKHPEYMICLPLMMAGLTGFVVEHTKEIYDEVKTFYKGAISILPNMVKGITQALSGTTFDKAAMNALNQLIDGAMTLGMGYLLYWENKLVDGIEEKAMNAIAKVGKMIALYMTLFAEFRWAMILVFIKNTKDQVDNRVKKIQEIRKALQALQYEEFISGGKDTIDQRNSYLKLYEAALLKLENTIPIVNNIERKLYKKSTFDKFLNDRVKTNLNDAENLLLKERNTFLEHFFHEKISDVADPDSMWKFYLSNDYTGVKVVENAPPKPIFWTDKPYGDNVTLKKLFLGIKVSTDNYLTISKLPYGVILPQISGGSWVEQKTTFDSEVGDYILYNKSFFKIKQIESVFIKDLSIDNFSPKGTVLSWYCDGFTKVELLADGGGGFTKRYTQNSIECGYIPGSGIKEVSQTNGHSAKFLFLESVRSFNILKDEKVELYREMNNSYFGLTYDWKLFNFTADGGYTMSNLSKEEDKIPPPYSLDIKKLGIEYIKQIWGDSKNYSLYPFFTINTSEKSFKMLGIYPNMVEKESERREKTALELPEPYKSMYAQYSNLKDKPINKLTGEDILNVGSTMSTFLFGKDIIKDNIYKLKNEVLSYDKYLQTASNLLGQMCPLKNDYLYFYTLLNTLKNLDTELDITNTIVLRDWIALNNRIILDTLTSMTYRNPDTNEFLTLDVIRNSPFLSALVPSALLDIDNIEMMKMFANMDNEMGTGLNKNRELQKMYFKLMNFIKWLRDMKVIEALQEAEDQVWSNIYNSLLSTIHRMLEGKEVSNIRPIMKKNMRILYILMIRLNQLSQNLGYFLDEGNQYTSIMTHSSMKDFQSFLNRNGLGHFYEYIKNGQWSKFINDEINEWVGKYSGLINCLLKYKEKFGLGGADKLYLDKIVNFLSRWQRGDILTQYELNVTGTFKSLNLNFLGKIPVGLKTSLSNNLKLIEVANNVKKQITKNLLTLN